MPSVVAEDYKLISSPNRSLIKDPRSPILIIGAGVVGLVLAQALKKHDIPFKIFDRDQNIDARDQGWGITIHWSLPELKQLLPVKLHEKLLEIQVDPKHGGDNDTGRFRFLNLATSQPIWDIPPAARLRISREKFRKLLLDGIDVQWNKCIDGFETTSKGVLAKFTDSTATEGCILIGADGANSTVRKLLCPSTGSLNQLPFRFLGATVKMGLEAIQPLRNIDPLLFQGCHPETGTFMWFSILESPEVNLSSNSETKSDHYYSAQINMSWPTKSDAGPTPPSNRERLALMNLHAANIHPVLRQAIEDIPEGTEIKEIRLADWPCLDWPNFEGKVTLLGDAAHAMTMYRGEAANHGIMDVAHLFRRLVVLPEDTVTDSSATQAQAITKFENEMRERTSWAVMMSRQACYDAHDFNSLDKTSAILARRDWALPK